MLTTYIEDKNDILNVAKVISFFAQQYYSQLIKPFKTDLHDNEPFSSVQSFLNFLSLFEEGCKQILQVNRLCVSHLTVDRF
jgi:hypothetical protein